MPNISQISGHTAAPHQSLRDSAIAQLKHFTRLLNDGNGPADPVIDDFIRNFDSTELLGPVLRGLSEEEKETVLRAAARCHVASFGRGREFLAKCNQLHLADEDSAGLIGMLPAESRAAMFAHAYLGDRGQIVLPFPDIGLCIPLGRTSLGTGEGALTTDEIRELLMYQEDQIHWLLEIFSAWLVHFDAETPDTETCHVWSDLIDRYIDGKPIVEFSKDREILEALAFTLMRLTDRVWARGCSEEFPMMRMITNGAEAYCLARSHTSCGTALLRLATFHMGKHNVAAAAEATKLAASVFARNALALWADGRYADAVVSQKMALKAYRGEAELRGVSGVPLEPTSGADDEIVPLPEHVEQISQSDFEGAWADQRAKTEEMRSQLASNLRYLAFMERFGKSRPKPSGPGTWG